MTSTENIGLELTEVCLGFEGTIALQEISIAFEPGMVTCIVGPNGAGKTTLFGVASGYLKPDSGSVTFKGMDISRMPPANIARLGVGRLFQDVRVFPRMSLLENITAARKQHPGDSLFASFVWPAIGWQAEYNNIQDAIKHLEFVGLMEHKDALAQNVSYGQQKLTALARLMNNNAECFLLDEPTAGLSPSAIENLLSTIRKLAEMGKTVVMIEHNLSVVRRIADFVYLLEKGKVEAFGRPAEF